jgi:hypothetical protein
MAQNLGVSLAFAVSALAIFYIYCIFGIEDRSSENISESDSMTGKAMTRPAGATI